MHHSRHSSFSRTIKHCEVQRQRCRPKFVTFVTACCVIQFCCDSSLTERRFSIAFAATGKLYNPWEDSCRYRFQFSALLGQTDAADSFICRAQIFYLMILSLEKERRADAAVTGICRVLQNTLRSTSTSPELRVYLRTSNYTGHRRHSLILLL